MSEDIRQAIDGLSDPAMRAWGRKAFPDPDPRDATIAALTRERDEFRELLRLTLERESAALNRATQAEAERDRLRERVAVLDGTSCAEERAAGNGGCGMCAWCCKQARDERDRLRDEVEKFHDGTLLFDVESQRVLMTRERDRLAAEVGEAKGLLRAVTYSESHGTSCDDVDGMNWWDARDAFLGRRAGEG